MKTGDINDLIDDQIERQGASVIRANDGHLFTFTRATLEKLLAAATKHPGGRAVLFIKHGAES